MASLPLSPPGTITVGKEALFKDAAYLTGLSHYGGCRGHVCVAGGYGGGQTYLSSAEYLPCDGRGWLPLPPMAHARTGFGLCYGPDGCLYAVGGSPNGSESHRSAERFDERRGVWEMLAHMVAGRSYW